MAWLTDVLERMVSRRTKAHKLEWLLSMPQRRAGQRRLPKIGARIMRHGRHAAFQLTGVAVPRARSPASYGRIDRLRGSTVATA